MQFVSKRIVLFLIMSANITFASSWDEIDASLQTNQCDKIKKEIDRNIIFLNKSYTPIQGTKDLKIINRSLKKLNEYTNENCLITENNKIFYKQEKIYWGTQKYKVKKMLGENPERPAWSADEAIKAEKERKKNRLIKKLAKHSINPLANALMGSGTSLYPAQSSPAFSDSYSRKIIDKLYGKEYDSFSPGQKKFIKNNLGLIHKITQRILTKDGYPEVSIKNKEQGTNIVSFYLHPNGSISELKLKSKIGFKSLDENTLKVVHEAYKDYPLPRIKTKIVFHVEYTL